MSNEQIRMMETGSPISSPKEGPAFILKKQAITWLNHILGDNDDVRKLENWKELFDAMSQYGVSLSGSDWMKILNDDIIGSYTKQEHPDIFSNVLKALPTNSNGYPLLLDESTYKYCVYVDGEWIEEEPSEEDIRMEDWLTELNEQIEDATKLMDDIESELGKDSL